MIWLIVLFLNLGLYNEGCAQQGQISAVDIGSYYNNEDVYEYERIFRQIDVEPAASKLNQSDWQKYKIEREKAWRDFYLKLALDYKEFVKKYPKSDVVDDAKLRMAEFYWLGKRPDLAKEALNDIIKNYPDGDYYAARRIYEMMINGKRVFKIVFSPNGEKTAAWALFWRGYWFHSKKDLEMIIKKYPNSPKAVIEAKIVLREWGIR